MACVCAAATAPEKKGDAAAPEKKGDACAKVEGGGGGSQSKKDDVNLLKLPIT